MFEKQFKNTQNSKLIESKPVFVIPLMQLLNRMLPCRPDDDYMGMWRLIMAHEHIGDQLIETMIVYSHSAHPELW